MDDPSRLWIFLYLISLDAELITSAFVFAQREQTQSDFEELEKTRPHYYKAALNYLNHPGRLIKAYAGISTGLFPLAGLSLYFLGRGAFAGRLTNNADVVILIDNLQLGSETLILLLTFQWVGIDLYALQHPTEDRLAFTIACRIELQMMAYLSPWTLAPPEHRHRDRTEPMLESILKQFGLTALPTPRRRNFSVTNRYQVLALTTSIEH